MSFNTCVIVYTENGNKMPLKANAVVHNHLGDHQLISPKYFFKTPVGIVFLERYVDFQQPIRADCQVLNMPFHLVVCILLHVLEEAQMSR
jgi:hypothetical protein